MYEVRWTMTCDNDPSMWKFKDVNDAWTRYYAYEGATVTKYVGLFEVSDNGAEKELATWSR